MTMWDFLDKHPTGGPLFLALTLMFAWLGWIQYATRSGR